MLPNIQFGVKMEIESPGWLSNEGIRTISQELHHWYGIEVPKDFDWSKTGVKGGRVTRNLSKLAHEQKKIALPPTVLTEIGNTYDRYYVPQKTYRFDFTHNLNWKAGDFGDEGSCFFGGSTSRHIIHYNGGYAVRFFGRNGGEARAWMFDVDDGAIMFNAYGRGMDLNRMSGIIARYFNLNSYNHVPQVWGNIDLYTNGSHHVNLIAKEYDNREIYVELSNIPPNYKLPTED